MLRVLLCACVCSLLVLQSAESAGNPCSPATHIPCNDGTCILKTAWCNSGEDCADGSDEKYCKKGNYFWPDPNSCKESHFLCSDGRCVPKITQCDSYKDCMDGSDELHCDKLTTSSPGPAKESNKNTDSKLKVDDSSEEDDYDYEDEKDTTLQTKPATETETQPTTETGTQSTTVTMESYEIIESTTQQTNPAVTTVNSNSEKEPSTLRPVSAGPRLNIEKQPSHLTILRSSGKNYSQEDINKLDPNYKNETNPTNKARDRNNNQNGRRQNGKNGKKQNKEPYPLMRQNRLEGHSKEGHMRHSSHLKTPSRFYFAKDYSAKYAERNRFSVDNARRWINGRRNRNGDWSKDTPRALIALSLLNNSFDAGTHEKDLMRKAYVVHLGVDLLRNTTKLLSPSQLAVYILASIATCHNPRDFLGVDLAKRLVQILDDRDRQGKHPLANPLVQLSLCLSDRTWTTREFTILVKLVSEKIVQDEVSKDTQSLAVLAFSCLMRRQNNNHQHNSYSVIMNDAVRRLLQRMKADGSFGSVYSTALAAQALMSVNYTFAWNPDLTVDYLKNKQLDDGSFGDMLATYFVLPVLSGRSMVHLRNTRCVSTTPDKEVTSLHKGGRRHFIRYSLYFGHPLVNAYSIQLRVPDGVSFFDVMKMAEQQNDLFRFSFEEDNGLLYVYSVSNVPNDSEQGVAWHLYVKNSPNVDQKVIHGNELQRGDIRLLKPKFDQHLIYWFHPIGDFWHRR